QFLIPVALQRAGDQAVFRLHRDIAAAGQVNLILGPFPAQWPLGLDLAGARFALVQRRGRPFEVSRVDGLPTALDDSRTARIAPQRLAGRGGVLGRRVVALVERRDAVL